LHVLFQLRNRLMRFGYSPHSSVSIAHMA
jgi:hypothetical protein